MMTTTAFRDRLREIEKGTGERQDAADAYRDQELSRLFDECGWTQEAIAKEMGKHQTWVSLRLRFGGFLKFMTSGHKDAPNLARLTERHFRRCWSKTKGKEAERFRQVVELLNGCDLLPSYKNLVTKPGYADAIRSALADGKWHKFGAIFADVEESHPEVTQQKLSDAIASLKKPRNGKRIESQKKAGVWRYRLVAVPDAADPARAAVSSLYEQIKPHLDDLLSMSRVKQGGLAPGELAKVAVRMQRLFDAACAEDTVDVQR